MVGSGRHLQILYRDRVVDRTWPKASTVFLGQESCGYLEALTQPYENPRGDGRIVALFV